MGYDNEEFFAWLDAKIKAEYAHIRVDFGPVSILGRHLRNARKRQRRARRGK